MKKILIWLLVTSFAMSSLTMNGQMNTFEINENKRLCKTFIKKAHKYEKTMRDDSLAETTLRVYKKRITSYCGTLIATR